MGTIIMSSSICIMFSRIVILCMLMKKNAVISFLLRVNVIFDIKVCIGQQFPYIFIPSNKAILP